MSGASQPKESRVSRLRKFFESKSSSKKPSSVAATPSSASHETIQTTLKNGTNTLLVTEAQLTSGTKEAHASAKKNVASTSKSTLPVGPTTSTTDSASELALGSRNKYMELTGDNVKSVHYYEFAPKSEHLYPSEPPLLVTEPMITQNNKAEQTQVDNPHIGQVDRLHASVGPPPIKDEPVPIEGQVIFHCAKAEDEMLTSAAVDETDGNSKDVRAALGFHTKIWTGKKKLKVYFMESDVKNLSSPHWIMGKSTLSTDTIMDWASEWNNALAKNIPKFVQEDSAEEADIRVSFKRYEGCWSKVGSDAYGTNRNQPTMNLNLSRNAADHRDFQRYLVIHEFGHALGLEHEHQRSDFWQVASKFLDKEKMETDKRMPADPNYMRRNFFQLEEGADTSCSSEYDPASVMHYWFDTKWIKREKYQNYNKVCDSTKLSTKERAILLGIHQNSPKNLRAKKPSETDLLYLNDLYGVRVDFMGNLSTRPQDRRGPPPVVRTTSECDQCITEEQRDSLELVRRQFDSLQRIKSADPDSMSPVLQAALRDYINSFCETSSPDVTHLKSHLQRLRYNERLIDDSLLKWGMEEVDDRFSKDEPQEEALFREEVVYHASLCCLTLDACKDQSCNDIFTSKRRIGGHSFKEVSISCDDEERYLIARQDDWTYYIAFEGRTDIREWPQYYSSFNEGVSAQANKVPIQFIVDLLDNNPKNRIVLTGFCFGGLLATYLTTRLWQYPYLGSKHLQKALVCITFAQPHLPIPDLDTIAQELPDIAKSIHSIYYEQDKIPLVVSLLDQKCSCLLVREATSRPGLHMSVNPEPETAFKDPLTQRLIQHLGRAMHPEPSSPSSPQDELIEVEETFKELNLGNPVATQLKRSYSNSYTHHSLCTSKIGLTFTEMSSGMVQALTSYFTLEDVKALFENHHTHTMKTYVDKLIRGHLEKSNKYTVPDTHLAPPPVTQVTPTLNEIHVAECTSELSLTLLGDNLWFCTQFELPGMVKEVQIDLTSTTSTCIKASVPDFDCSSLSECCNGDQLSVTLSSHFVQKKKLSPTLTKQENALAMRQQHIDTLKPSKLIELTCLTALLDRLPQGHFMESKKVKIIEKFIELALKVVPLEGIGSAVNSSNERVSRQSSQILADYGSTLPPSRALSGLAQRVACKGESLSRQGSHLASPAYERQTSLSLDANSDVLSGANIDVLYPSCFPKAMSPVNSLKQARDTLNDLVKLDQEHPGDLTFTDSSAVADVVTDFRQNVLPTCIALLGEYLESQKILVQHGALPRLHDLTEERKLEMLSKGEYQQDLSLESSLMKTLKGRPYAAEIEYSYELENRVAKLCMDRNICYDYPLDTLTKAWHRKSDGDEQAMAGIFEGTPLSLIVESHVPVVARWLKWGLLVNNLRKQVIQEFPPAIGVVGLVNSGKTKLVHSLFRIQVSSGTTEQNRTTIPFIYNLRETAGNVDIVDFPGVDDIDKSVGDVADLILTLAQVIIYIVDYRKIQTSVSKQWLDTLRSKGVPLLVCLTYADKLYADESKKTGNQDQIQKAMEKELKNIKFRMKLPRSLHIRFCTFSQDSDSIFNNDEGRAKLRNVDISTPADVGQWIADTFENRLDNADLATSLRGFFSSH